MSCSGRRGVIAQIIKMPGIIISIIRDCDDPSFGLPVQYPPGFVHFTLSLCRRLFQLPVPLNAHPHYLPGRISRQLQAQQFID